MLEQEFKDLLHKIALALGIAHNHPDPMVYADGVVTAHDSIIANAKPPDPVIDPVELVAGAQVLTDGVQWPHQNPTETGSTAEYPQESKEGTEAPAAP